MCVWGEGITENCRDEALGWWENFHLLKITPGMSWGFRRTAALQNFVVKGWDQGCIHPSIYVYFFFHFCIGSFVLKLQTVRGNITKLPICIDQPLLHIIY